MISRTATVASSVGLHARPAATLASAAAEFDDFEITLTFDGEEADAASALEIMALGAEHGDTVEVSVDDDSDEAKAALDEVVRLIESDLDA